MSGYHRKKQCCGQSKRGILDSEKTSQIPINLAPTLLNCNLLRFGDFIPCPHLRSPGSKLEKRDRPFSLLRDRAPLCVHPLPRRLHDFYFWASSHIRQKVLQIVEVLFEDLEDYSRVLLLLLCLWDCGSNFVVRWCCLYVELFTKELLAGAVSGVILVLYESIGFSRRVVSGNCVLCSESFTAMGRKGSFDNNVSFSGFTSRKDKIELQSSVLSTATQSTIDAGASRTKSFSEGTITRHQIDAEVSTISSDGIPLAHQSSISRVVSLEPALPLNKGIIYPVTGKVEQDQLVDDIQSNCKLTSKAPYTDKHLMSESSSSNSSHVIAPNHSESKGQLELQVDTKPGRVHKAFECSLLVDEKSNETVRSASVGSASLKKGEFLKGILKQLKSCDEQATSETSQLSEQLCLEKMKPTESVSPETWHESKEAAYEEQQMSKFRVTSDQGPNVCGFDLNEDLEVNEVGNADNSVDESAYHHEANVPEPIVVVAKVGVPNGLPTAPLQFDGELGWRRSLGTSAFRPTFTCKKSVKNTGSYGMPTASNSTPSLGFDLNVAPPSEPRAVGSSVEIGIKESDRLTLNLDSEGNKYHGRPNSQILSFDLNDNLLIDKDSLSCQPKRNYAPVDSMSGSARQGNVSAIRPAYWVDLSSMPGFTHVQGQPFIVAAPTLFPSAEQKQPNVALAPGPPSGYYIGTTNGLSPPLYSPNMLPHVGGQHGTSTTFPQMSGPLLAAYPGSLHLMEGLNPGGYTTMRPNFYLNAGVGSSENANRMGNAPAEERVRLSQTVALADKRKEPDGSWGSYQHNHRRMTTWK